MKPMQPTHQKYQVKNHIAKITAFGLVAAALAVVPTISRSQDASSTTNAPAQTPPKKHHGAIPFHGKVVAVDASAETLTVGKLTLNITSTTKISNATNGEPAILSDIIVGETVGGSYKKRCRWPIECPNHSPRRKSQKEKIGRQQHQHEFSFQLSRKFTRLSARAAGQ
jgi:hypothetical protein